MAIALGVIVMFGSWISYGAPPAFAAGSVLYAAPTAQGTGDCSSIANACTLTKALSSANAGTTVELTQAGASGSFYVGNWTVSTPTSLASPIAIEPAPGVVNPILDGNWGLGSSCSTLSCDGSVLTISDFATISGITIHDGFTSGDGGGINNEGTLTLSNSTISDNYTGNGRSSTGDGGGINNEGTLTVSNSTISLNGTGDGEGVGAVGSLAGNAGSGGGISNLGTLTVSNSTISDNHTGNGGDTFEGFAGSGGYGGGIYSDRKLTVSNSTIDGNTAGHGGTNSRKFGPDGAGGGLFSGGSSTISNSTIVGNHTRLGGAIDSSSLTLTASMLINPGAGGNCNGDAPTDGGYNVDSDGSCVNGGTGDSSGVLTWDENGPLANNGGPTETDLPLAGNPALGIVPAGTPGLCPMTDQRGFSSTVGAACDAGSVQVPVVQAPTVPGAPTSLTATAGHTAVNLSWTAPASNGGSAITHYRIYGSALNLIATVTGTTYTNTGLTNGTTYFYKVAADNAVGEGPLSNQASATPVAAPTTTALGQSSASIEHGQPVTFTATVSTAGGGAPAGAVQFKDSGANLGAPVTLVGNGPNSSHASLTTSSLSLGSHSVTAAYTSSNLSLFLNSTSSAVTHTVTTAATSTVVAPSSASTSWHHSVTFHATVSTAGSGPPSGSVQFKDGSSNLGPPVAVVANGPNSSAANLSTSSLLVGSHPITAVFTSSDFSLFLNSRSAAITHVVTAFSPCTRTVTGNVGSVTVAAGEMVCLSGANVAGSVTVNAGGGVWVQGGSIGGDTTASSPSQLKMCAAAAQGSVTVSNATGSVLIGDYANDDVYGCAGSSIGTDLTVSGNQASTEIGGNTIGRNASMTGVTGRGPSPDDNAPEIEANTLRGALDCSSNTPAPTNDGAPNRISQGGTGQCVSL